MAKGLKWEEKNQELLATAFQTDGVFLLKKTK